MSTAPHLWKLILEARKAGAPPGGGGSSEAALRRVADEHLAPMPGTDAALALGMMRAVVDAGLQDEDWCRAFTSGYDELLERLDDYPVGGLRGDLRRGCRGDRRVGREFASHAARAPAPGRGRPAPLGAPAGVPDGGVPAGAHRRVAAPRRRLLLHPHGHRRRISEAPLQRATCGRARCGRSTCRRWAMRSPIPSLDPPVKALVCWNSNPAQVAPEQGKVLEGLRRDDLFTVVLEQFMTDTALHADVVLPATTQLEHLDLIFSWGHHWFTLSEAAIDASRRGQAEHRGVPPDRRADGTRRSVLLGDRRGDARGAGGRRVAGVTLDERRARGFAKADLGPGGRRPTPRAVSPFPTASSLR